MTLQEFSADALKRKMEDAIMENAGWISFARYMDMALYEPGLGYYNNGGIILGRDGDFVTAPEISALFGQTLAHALVPLMAQSAPRILEIGAGSGKLAHDILEELALLGIHPEHYDILDLSGNLRLRQQQMLTGFPQVRWLDRLPDTFTGVIIGNEALDAMPVQRVKKKNGRWHELGVSLSQGHLVSVERPAKAGLLEQIAWQIPDADELEEGYVTEVHTHACAFIRSLAEVQKAGEGSAAIFIDYGYPAREYYLPERNRGTLMSYYRHRSHSDPFLYPGSQDITAHVDFSALARVAVENGLDVLCYASQAGFLLAGGITDRLLRLSPEDAVRYLPEARKAQMLLSPAEMGELFKVLVFGNLDLPAQLAAINRSDRL
ncbi:SAM-dependent methyltransferase [Oxalobacter sp. OttesenSCG-928-P03]|nr:SAM-dependent methyltransferase [Oxalobacter sp. OttesenSCG-928-P03]